jgi:hypothetical protein
VSDYDLMTFSKTNGLYPLTLSLICDDVDLFDISAVNAFGFEINRLIQ